MATLSFFMHFPLMRPFDKRGCQGGELPDNLECSNFIFWLLATCLLGKATQLIQIQNFCFFEHPYFPVLKKKAGGIGFNFFRTKIRLSLSPARLSLGLTELDKSYGIYFNTTLISQNMNKVLLSVTGYINPAPMSSLSWLTKREMLRASSNTGELVMELRSETVTAVFFN